VTLPGRDGGEVDALVTDRYLDALLAGDPALMSLGGTAAGAGAGARRARPAKPSVDDAVRTASRRLSSDLPRFHPSFRFEERLALRLAETAAAMRLPMAAGSEGQVARIPVTPGFDPLGVLPDDEDAGSDASAGEAWRDALDPSAVLRRSAVRGAVAASALSLAGAAWYAWRHRPSSSPMARAARAAHAAHAGHAVRRA
jgi:hypothetical protein